MIFLRMQINKNWENYGLALVNETEYYNIYKI